MSERINGLRTEIIEAVRRMENYPEPDPMAPLAVGDVFCLPHSGDAGLFWLVVNFHPDTGDTVLVVPMDDAFWVGVCDVVHQSPCQGAPFVLRCGYSHWASVSALTVDRRCFAGEEWAGAAAKCRAVLAKMARGHAITVTIDQEATEEDPEYWAHCAEVERVGRELWG